MRATPRGANSRQSGDGDDTAAWEELFRGRTGRPLKADADLASGLGRAVGVFLHAVPAALGVAHPPVVHEAVTAHLADAAELVGAQAAEFAVEPRALLAPVGHDRGRTAREGRAAREQRDERRQQEGTAAHGRLSHAPALDIGPL